MLSCVKEGGREGGCDGGGVVRNIGVGIILSASCLPLPSFISC